MSIDRLIDVILNSVKLFIPFVVVDAYERGVVLRFGVFNRELGPGLHWCWPFSVERVLHDNVVTRTHMMPSQTLTTKDGKTISVTAVVTCRIKHVRKALLEVEGAEHALLDSCSAHIAAHVGTRTWEELRTDAAEVIVAPCRKQAFTYGIEIDRVQLSDLALCRVVRLIGSTRL